MISLQDKKRACFYCTYWLTPSCFFFSYIHTVRHFDFENNIIWCRFEGHSCYHFNKPMSKILRRKLDENWLVLAFNGTQVTVRGYHRWCLYKMSEWGCHIITPFYLNDPYFLLSPFNLPQMWFRLTYAWC